MAHTGDFWSPHLTQDWISTNWNILTHSLGLPYGSWKANVEALEETPTNSTLISEATLRGSVQKHKPGFRLQPFSKEFVRNRFLRWRKCGSQKEASYDLWNVRFVSSCISEVQDLNLNTGKFASHTLLPLSKDAGAPSTTVRPRKLRHVEIVIPIQFESCSQAEIVPSKSASDIEKCSGLTLLEASALAPEAMPNSPSNERRPKSSSSSKRSSKQQQTTLQVRETNSKTPPTNVDNQAKIGSGEGTIGHSISENYNPVSAAMISGQPQLQTAAASPSTSNATNNLSGLLCNVHQTTGVQPPALVGASTTISGDKLYVFGGRRLSRRKPQMMKHLYELDLIRRHWARIETHGDAPAPRYFHSMCSLGDTKLVCYGGMAPSPIPEGTSSPNDDSQQQEMGTVVMSDVHIYDIATSTWVAVPATDPPQGRYAHCAAMLPSSGVFSSATAAHSAIQHNQSPNTNSGTLGLSIDGRGGAEMVVVGGQDSSNQYIEQISVFNLRSLKWKTVSALGRSLGAYRSVVAPLTGMEASQIGSRTDDRPAWDHEDFEDEEADESGSATLIYSNFNFLDVKLELQVRMQDGSLIEKSMRGNHSPPGLRFPSGGVINNHFVISGTFLTSTKQEYALWALNLKTLKWTRVDAGGGIFNNGSWNRGVLWNRRNAFVILGNRKRNLAEDYNHRRINFTNVCTVELEAFGLYDNPRMLDPSARSLSSNPPVLSSRYDPAAGGRTLSAAASDLGRIASGLRELCDMDILAVGGERVSVNSHFIARRWGQYFSQILRESTTRKKENASFGSETAPSRNSSITITPSVATTATGTTVTSSNPRDSTSKALQLNNGEPAPGAPHRQETQHTPQPLAPAYRPRLLYLPHTYLTVRALVHYLYTSSLPPIESQLCSPQILCSLLQIARPYRVDGLLEATVDRLHEMLDGRNTAAVFNAAAMAAGGGEGTAFVNGYLPNLSEAPEPKRASRISRNTMSSNHSGRRATKNVSESEDEPSSTSTSTTDVSDADADHGEDADEIWAGELSAVVGLQKRGLRGLMEGRKLREKGSDSVASAPAESTGIGLGIA